MDRSGNLVTREQLIRSVASSSALSNGKTIGDNEKMLEQKTELKLMGGILTPKYWVLWDNHTNDIVIKTLDKSLQGARDNAYRWLGAEYVLGMEEEDVFEFKLISIEEVRV